MQTSKGILFLACALLLAVANPAGATNISLGQAGQYTVLSLDSTFQNQSNVTINGDVGIGPNGSASVMAPSLINGTLYRDPTATASGPGTISGGIQVRDLHQAINDAIAAANAFDALAATQVLSSISAAVTLTGNGGDNVIDVNGTINLAGSNNLTLNGGANDFFIFNVTGGLTLGGNSSVVLNGGVTANHVIFNFLGSGAQLTSHVGNVWQGTILAVDRSVNFHGINGQIIAGGPTLTLMSGATVNSIPFVPEIPTSSALLLGFVMLAGLMRFRRRSNA